MIPYTAASKIDGQRWNSMARSQVRESGGEVRARQTAQCNALAFEDLNALPLSRLWHYLYLMVVCTPACQIDIFLIPVLSIPCNLAFSVEWHISVVPILCPLHCCLASADDHAPIPVPMQCLQVSSGTTPMALCAFWSTRPHRPSTVYGFTGPVWCLRL